MWERFSYYGMRALLMLFMTAPSPTGGWLHAADGGAIYGLYTSMVYMMTLPAAGSRIASSVSAARCSTAAS